MDIVDTHCHIHSIGQNPQSADENTYELWSKFDKSVDEVIKEAEANRVTKLIVVGCSVEDSKLVTNFVKTRPNCYASIGIHPHEASRYINEPVKLEYFKNLVNDQKVVAIGECGLDYHYNHSLQEDQKAILRLQIELAQSNDLPVIFHLREAFDDFWPIFDECNKKRKIRGVLHSFTDTKENLKLAIDRGLYIGVNGIATFSKDESLNQVYKSIPLNKLLLETDSPYLTPSPIRGTINTPKNVRLVVEFMAGSRDEDVLDLISHTTDNAKTLFKI